MRTIDYSSLTKNQQNLLDEQTIMPLHLAILCGTTVSHLKKVVNSQKKFLGKACILVDFWGKRKEVWYKRCPLVNRLIRTSNEAAIIWKKYGFDNYFWKITRNLGIDVNITFLKRSNEDVKDFNNQDFDFWDALGAFDTQTK